MFGSVAFALLVFAFLILLFREVGIIEEYHILESLFATFGFGIGLYKFWEGGFFHGSIFIRDFH